MESDLYTEYDDNVTPPYEGEVAVAEACEGCSHCKYPGIRWPAATNGYDAFPFVERCDYCERYPGDDEAAAVVAEGEGNPVEYAPVPGGLSNGPPWNGYPYVRPREEVDDGLH